MHARSFNGFIDSCSSARSFLVGNISSQIRTKPIFITTWSRKRDNYGHDRQKQQRSITGQSKKQVIFKFKPRRIVIPGSNTCAAAAVAAESFVTDYILSRRRLSLSKS
jgi:hypothetical protein